MKRAPVVGPYSDVSQEEDAPATAVNLPQKRRGKRISKHKNTLWSVPSIFFVFVLQVKRRRREKKREFGF